jgi:non-specific serine/threonine protein kinase
LLASSRIASEGLTLTEANHVLFFNQWWNPSANHQARDRVNRIGQKKAVFIYNFVICDSVEERLQDVLIRKGRTFEEIIGRLSNQPTATTEEERELIRSLLRTEAGDIARSCG